MLVLTLYPGQFVDVINKRSGHRATITMLGKRPEAAHRLLIETEKDLYCTQPDQIFTANEGATFFLKHENGDRLRVVTTGAAPGMLRMGFDDQRHLFTVIRGNAKKRVA